jgi:hypothetical protein
MATTKNDDPVQRRYGRAAQLQSYASAAWCGISLLAISAFMTAVEVYLLTKFFLAGVVGLLIVLGLGVAYGRFLLRALPPAISDQGRRGRSWTLALNAAFIIAVYIFQAFLLAVPLASEQVNRDVALSVILVMVLLLAMFWASGAIGLLIYRHRRPRAFLDRPFVLFLRRFSTFSDRAIIAVILKQAANNAVPVVFLTPTLSRPGDWDPYLVGFAGLKLLYPWRSAPIVLRVQDSAWQGVADELIRRAHTILLDTSEESSALRTEAEMLDRAGRWPDTVCLTHLVPNASSGKDHSFGGMSGARTIDYTKSWVRALPRMVIGLLIVPLAAFFFYMPLLFLDQLDRFERLFALPAPNTAAAVVAAAAYYYSVFVRPTINREAKVALRTLLRAVRTKSTDTEAPQGIKGWLILPVIVLIIVPTRDSYVLLTLHWPILRDGTWEKLTTPSSAVYHHLWAPLITYEIVGTLVIIVLAITTLVLLFQKSKKTPAFAIACLSINTVYVLLDYFFSNLIPAVAQQSGPDDMRELILTFAGAAIWILYFIFSRRVNATFVG